jgi:hypothetical protein
MNLRRPFLKIIKQRSNAVNNLTTSGSPTVRVDERARPAANFVKAPL